MTSPSPELLAKARELRDKMCGSADLCKSDTGCGCLDAIATFAAEQYAAGMRRAAGALSREIEEWRNTDHLAIADAALASKDAEIAKLRQAVAMLNAACDDARAQLAEITKAMIEAAVAIRAEAEKGTKG